MVESGVRVASGREFALGLRIVAPSVLLAVALVAPHAAAQQQPGPPAPPEKPAAPADPLTADLESLRKLVTGSKWQQGADLAKSVFTKYQGDLRVVARADEILADLRTCLWQLARKDEPLHLAIGRGCTKANAASREAEFECGDGPDGAPGWSSAESGVRVFEAPFEDVSVGFEFVDWNDVTGDKCRWSNPPAVVLHFDSERSGGYVLQFDVSDPFRTRSGIVFGMRAGIRRWGEKEKLLSPDDERTRSIVNGSDPIVVTASERSYKLELRRDSRVLASATDSTHASGQVALVGSKEAWAAMRRLTIRGKLTTTWLRRIRNEREDEREREWAKTSWDPKAQLPKWVHDAREESEYRRCLLPSDATPELRTWFRANWDRIAESDPKWLVQLVGWAAKAPPLTGRYAGALAAHLLGRTTACETELAALAEAEPGFGPAWALRAKNALLAGDAARTAQLLAEAKERAAYHPWTWETAVECAFDASDLPAAQAALDAATHNLAGSATLRDLASALVRIRRGPDWTKSFRAESANYVVVTDHSDAVAREVLTALDEARAAFVSAFRKPPAGPAKKAKVYVFSGFESYADYGAQSGTRLDGTLGVYRPILRELLVYLHEDRRELRNTIRHEGFHQYLHQFVPTAPIWFNEGTAEWFGFTRGRTASVKGRTDTMQSFSVAAFRRLFVPIEDLVRMQQPEFMLLAAPRYCQSWALVRFLRDTKDARFKGLLDRYTDAILAGKSADEAYEAILKPSIGALQPAFDEYATTLAIPADDR